MMIGVYLSPSKSIIENAIDSVRRFPIQHPLECETTLDLYNVKKENNSIFGHGRIDAEQP